MDALFATEAEERRWREACARAECVRPLSERRSISLTDVDAVAAARGVSRSTRLRVAVETEAPVGDAGAVPPRCGRPAGEGLPRTAYAHRHCASILEACRMGAQSRKATNLSLDADLLRDARTLGVNLSRAAEEGLRAAVKAARAEAWRQANAEALDSANAWVEDNGLPLAAFRQF